MNFSRSSIWLHSFQGTFALLAKAPLCNPCLRNELSPISQEGHATARQGSVLVLQSPPNYDPLIRVLFEQSYNRVLTAAVTGNWRSQHRLVTTDFQQPAQPLMGQNSAMIWCTNALSATDGHAQSRP